MICPACKAADAGVLETRISPAGIRRRRRCSACGHRITTLELIVPDGLRLDASVSVVPTRAAVALVNRMHALFYGVDTWSASDQTRPPQPPESQAAQSGTEPAEPADEPLTDGAIE